MCERFALKIPCATGFDRTVGMLFAGWNQEEALAVRYNEGIEVGVNKCRNENAKKVLDLIAKGYTLEDIQRELASMVQGS